MKVGVLKETFPDERRVALVPAGVTILKKSGLDVEVEAGSGNAAGFTDDEYRDKGAEIIADRNAILSNADILLQVRGYGANPEFGKNDLKSSKPGQIVIGFQEPLTAKAEMSAYAEHKLTVFATELVPRITRAQSMDTLSSMANLAGYKAVLLAANYLPKIFPMMMTAAGTIVAAKVLIVGVGVAGLQAIATARRLGAIVHAYDIRPAVKEQVLSLGAKFVEMELEAGDAETSGGYAKAMDE
ncbi:MAG: NAD(P)(+) transhydrogenase (Re/Si-specific) subunit alpha, partial [Calditrichaeota bacterium]|nr:NAD(P)(+) transhydrogenase (Re/Si-specific) subunit alpha [Calditrichota bacterium]